MKSQPITLKNATNVSTIWGDRCATSCRCHASSAASPRQPAVSFSYAGLSSGATWSLRSCASVRSEIFVSRFARNQNSPIPPSVRR